MNMKEEYKWELCVRCFTYNHAPYIVDAMNGFTMQQTSFPFVCTIVDDASTDGTQVVIKNYLFDNFNMKDNLVVIIKETKDYCQFFAQHKVNRNCYFAVLFLKYNHYSRPELKNQKIKYISEWYDVARYIALCEGDDYWIDSNKLQKQYEALENNPDSDMCAHNAYISNGKSYSGKLGALEEDGLLKPENVIEGGGAYLSTNSLLYRNANIFNRYKMYQFLPIDYTMQIVGSLRGGIVFLADYMSVYRQFSNATAWTYKMKLDKERRINHREKVIKALDILNDETEKAYFSSIEKQKKKLRYLTSLECFDLQMIYAQDNNELYKQLPFKKKLELFVYSKCPRLVIYVRKLFNKGH